MRRLFLTTCLLSLSGCATLSFAPPQVRHDRELYATNQQTFLNATCTPDHADTNPIIHKDVDGALALVENYILTYGCQADRAAEGRQFFEVPGFLIAATAATAAAFGAGANVAIGAGAGELVLKHGHDYYSPKDKAEVFRAAFDAFNCIKREASGIDTDTLRAVSAAQSSNNAHGQQGGAKPPQPGTPQPGTPQPGTPDVEASLAGGSADQPISVSIPSEKMYFNAVQSAIDDVVNTVRSRLSNVGKAFDGAGVVAQIKQFGQDAQATETAAGSADQAGEQLKKAVAPAATVQTQAGIKLYSASGATPAQTKLLSMDDERVGRAIIDVRALSPKLAVCAVGAKV